MIELEIQAKAVSKERPRFHRNFGYAYTPRKTKDFESIIAAHCAIYMRDKKLTTIEDYVHAEIVIYSKVPAAWSKKKTQEALSGLLRPTKSDIDNQLKAIFDGLNGIAYVDDKQIVSLSAEKLYHLDDIIKIKINKL